MRKLPTCTKCGRPLKGIRVGFVCGKCVVEAQKQIRTEMKKARGVPVPKK